jgi:membrane protein DedA with SNARE-associated domain
MEWLASASLWALVILVTLIGLIIKLSYYFVGKRGGEGAVLHMSGMTPEQWQDLQDRFRHWGTPLLVLAAIPGVGPAVTVAAGVLNVRLLAFCLWVFLGTLVRNTLIALLASGAVHILS